MVMFFSQACRCGRLGAPATLSFHPVLIVFLCFEIRSPLSSRCGHVFQPSLSLWTAWRACYFEFPSCSSIVGLFVISVAYNPNLSEKL